MRNGRHLIVFNIKLKGKGACVLGGCQLWSLRLRYRSFSCCLLADGGICFAITPEDFEKAFEGFTPAALRGVSLHTAGELGWSDVGGLSAVKAALMETLLWPTKVNPCPLRHLTVKKYLLLRRKRALATIRLRDVQTQLSFFVLAFTSR